MFKFEGIEHTKDLEEERRILVRPLKLQPLVLAGSNAGRSWIKKQREAAGILVVRRELIDMPRS